MGLKYTQEKLPQHLLDALEIWIHPKMFQYILSHKNCYIAGGAVKDVVANQEPNDIDVYFLRYKDYKDFVSFAMTVTKRKFKIYKTNLAVSFDDNVHKRLQAIKCTCGPVYKVLNEFDFTIVKGAIWDNKLIKCTTFDQDNASKQLVYCTTKAPASSVYRVKKYQGRGYTISEDDFNRLQSDLKAHNGHNKMEYEG